ANKVTVYWDPVPNATGYRVRWGTSSGMYPNVSSVQPADARMLSITGLTTQQEYYFVVEAERNGVWSAPSEEDSAIPHVGAIPWDSGDARSILQAVRSLTGNHYDDLSALSPDGVYYSSIGGAVQSEWPAPLQYNTTQGVVETSDGGLLMPLQMEDEGEGILSILQQRDHTGPYRRIRTDSQHPCIGARGSFFLPQWYVFVPSDTHASTRDTPHVYFGIAYNATGGRRVDIEGGISYHPSGRGVRRTGREEGKTPGSPPPSYARWMPYMRIRIEKPREQDTDEYIPVVGTTGSDLPWNLVLCRRHRPAHHERGRVSRKVSRSGDQSMAISDRYRPRLSVLPAHLHRYCKSAGPCEKQPASTACDFNGSTRDPQR
ncbi:MAG: fibronectin type III domain-containing protein, partial [Candidatus Methanosuratincola sp.]